MHPAFKRCLFTARMQLVLAHPGSVPSFRCWLVVLLPQVDSARNAMQCRMHGTQPQGFVPLDQHVSCKSPAMCEMPRTDIYCIMDGTVYGYRKLLPGWHDYVYGMCVSRCIHIATHGGLIVSQRLNGEQIARNKASQVCISFSFTTCCIFFLLLLLLFYLHMTLRVAYSNGSVNSTSYEQHRA